MIVAMKKPPQAPTYYGSEPQKKLLDSLSSELGYASLDEALAAIEMEAPLSLAEASSAIDALMQKKQAARAEQASGAGESGGAANGGKGAEGRVYFSPAKLLQLAETGSPIPADADPAAKEIFRRLMVLRGVMKGIGELPGWNGTNGGGPIPVEHLIQHFGSVDKVAAEFGVSADTVRGWGVHVPKNRSYEAEVKTGRMVCAPRG